MGINRRGIEQFTRELQREFDKHPIRLPVEGDASRLGGTTIYNGPVIIGSAAGARLAWNNTTADQSVNQTAEIAPGFEDLGRAVVAVLDKLSTSDVGEDDRRIATDAGDEVLAEITEAEPDVGKIKRAVATLKGVLAPFALAASTGAGEGVTEWAKEAIAHLTAGI